MMFKSSPGPVRLLGLGTFVALSCAFLDWELYDRDLTALPGLLSFQGCSLWLGLQGLSVIQWPVFPLFSVKYWYFPQLPLASPHDTTSCFPDTLPVAFHALSLLFLYLEYPLRDNCGSVG